MFIVIEGIDGAGCETQAKLVSKQLTTNHQSPTALIKFPHYDTPVGKMIKDFLYLNQKMSAHEQFLLYTLQFIFDAPHIREQSKHQIMIADRYFTTTLCYQALEGFDETFALQYAQQFGIIKPDIVFFLDVSPETAIHWKHGEDKEKNFREKDHKFIKKTYVKYQDLVKRQVWTKWIHINGEQQKEKVTQEILKYLV
ncbi:dTMP kinase [Candidatus Roizmanbacteria bacterium RIFOXYB2_FULL_38_10]|uniref:Thymidylate kinase n=1 Tax=Candidatus Roizmanbacteria bacterium RIFOXYD1_FULL_38_12 TaxID=1802093 RepID=A0A1F7L1K5_9BACT|nr:MAG: dTMP kinase [Candidatus Roizmanbacteria bacterium RIFOXYA2_FULL_38_14]OGK63986.1 MAG: dTMP kinase [Candidatus Roizmanbacteria bacterium RIFOXYA1_FULL_37_12]OGK65832.1 MAG: dTMP kinase [Candidatus Roizmanbacteria bacterium RIFOXYB1_FULL_40_23]OGK68940.1 MAG: dTMP kinase [Candidatus Roizmanbacteria bacterium RIFOXYB2_FULL_38_10]OGK70237.1 MAG: dTMP kinase [Candidatus Roizmanbacteria bacterium RIFOXYC1_FULL_38_14]OGK72146.1 MAG: dTMP kinase [Candidatus Roizmanbacteria bacterium RIFOXYC2_F